MLNELGGTKRAPLFFPRCFASSTGATGSLSPPPLGGQRAATLDAANALTLHDITALPFTVKLKSHSQLTFDVHRTVRLPCHVSEPVPSHVCVITKPVTRGAYWYWARSAIGHAAEFLFKCWSFLAQAEEEWEKDQLARGRRPAADERPLRLIVDRFGRDGDDGAQGTPFQAQLMAAMRLGWARDLPTSCARMWSVCAAQPSPALHL